ncbi:uroporphyrinogen-III synthase [Pseudomonas sp. LRF_L74]|uniref:uroporphyrinogen-III synthase n=1 Tax=Pseudomonas sp. LRF_L74 TaxID=3369422 RepID=UPI003F63F269
MTAWRVLLTRPAAENETLEVALDHAGIASATLPLLEIEALEETGEQRSLIMELDRYQAVIVVSKPAARIGLERVDRLWPQPPIYLRWFAVGAGTAAILDDYGVDVRYPDSGEDSEALLAMPALDEALQAPIPRALILRGEGGRELIAETLRERGVAVDYLPLYRRVLPEYPAGTLMQKIQAERLNAVLVSSAQGLEHLRRLAADAWKQVAGMTLLVPSARVAERAREAGARCVIECRGASAAAVVSALQNTAPTTH